MPPSKDPFDTTKITVAKHARSRQAQRGISDDELLAIQVLGRAVPRPGGAVEYAIDKKTAKQLHKSIDRLTGKAVLLDQDELRVVTAYHLI